MANTIDLGKVREIVEVSDDRHGPRYANQYLKMGWQLIGTHVHDWSDEEHRREVTVYVMGWTRDEEPRHPPKERTW